MLPEPLASPVLGAFDGRVAFAQLVRQTLAHAAATGAREMVLCDPDFADWPLGERAVEAHLQDWSASGRQCILLARKFDVVSATHHRFVAWRRQWSHIVQAWAAPQIGIELFPSACVMPGWGWHRLDVAHVRGVAFEDADRLRALRELLADVQANSASAFPATILGL
jgi:hypothetical protein